ncbi:MAG: hypothetical protein HY556_06845 [Euryarchaeota archaeon]|nr:hypothetical protein [Euryarchaeota archaeon]
MHLVISTADALTTFYLGERSRSQDHGDAAQLLRRIPVTGIEEHADKALEVIRVKNVVEYEAREFEETEATATMKKALRFHEWGRQQLGER